MPSHFRVAFYFEISALNDNKRPMGLDALLDNADKSSKHIIMYDKQMHQITPNITLMAQGQKSSYLCFTGVTECQI